MLQSISIWIFLYRLKFKYRKNDKWIISNEFISAVINGFNDNWLKNIKMEKFLITDINAHYKNKTYLLVTINSFAMDISKDIELNVTGQMFNSFPENLSFYDFMLDENKKQIDLFLYQKELKSKSKKLINELELSKTRSELQHGYYKRNVDKILLDILEMYWAFIQITK